MIGKIEYLDYGVSGTILLNDDKGRRIMSIAYGPKDAFKTRAEAECVIQSAIDLYHKFTK